MTSVTNVAIEWLTLPELAGATQHLITFVSGEALPRMHNRTHRESDKRRKERVHVVLHYAPPVKRVVSESCVAGSGES